MRAITLLRLFGRTLNRYRRRINNSKFLAYSMITFDALNSVTDGNHTPKLRNIDDTSLEVKKVFTSGTQNAPCPGSSLRLAFAHKEKAFCATLLSKAVM